MSIKVTRHTETKENKATSVFEWGYGECGVEVDGWIWCRAKYGAIGLMPHGEVVLFTPQELRDAARKAVKDPNLTLELIFTKGK